MPALHVAYSFYFTHLCSVLVVFTSLPLNWHFHSRNLVEPNVTTLASDAIALEYKIIPCTLRLRLHNVQSPCCNWATVAKYCRWRSCRQSWWRCWCWWSGIAERISLRHAPAFGGGDTGANWLLVELVFPLEEPNQIGVLAGSSRRRVDVPKAKNYLDPFSYPIAWFFWYGSYFVVYLERYNRIWWCM